MIGYFLFSVFLFSLTSATHPVLLQHTSMKGHVVQYGVSSGMGGGEGGDGEAEHRAVGRVERLDLTR